MSSYRSYACRAVVLVAILALNACGGATVHHNAAATGSTAQPSAGATTTTTTTQPSGGAQPPSDAAAEPNAIVATVGAHVITKAMRAHALAFRGEALNMLIVQQWVIGGAAEAGVHVGDRELEQALKTALGGKSQAQFTKEALAISGRTWADFALETKVQLLSEGIRHMLERKTAHPTQAQIAAYYSQNKQLFGVPKQRDLWIVRAASEAEARKLKAEIAAGKTFASVSRQLPAAHRPFFSKEGSVVGYQPHLYAQAPLDHAIFAAKPSVLSGPISTTLGYYVFEVTRVHPPHQKTLAQVQAAIGRELPKMLYKRALVAFIHAWRKRWRARTDCRPGYVVTNCKQYKPIGVPAPNEDPYTLN